MTVKNPLIVPVGISHYDSDVNHSLKCVPSDFKNVQYSFHVVRGYDMAYYNEKNQFVLKRGKHGTAKTNSGGSSDSNGQNNNQSKSNAIKGGTLVNREKFKLRWNEKEIFELNDKICQLVSDSRYNYDCLIYFILCHGDIGGIIYDSHGNKIPLITIFDKFSNQNCISLRNKPKIYFVEACRGDRRTKRHNNSNLLTKVSSINTNCLSLAQSNTSQSTTPVPASDDTVEELEEKQTNTVDIKSNPENEAYTLNSKGIKSQLKQSAFSKYNYNREIYGNTEGYGVVEPGSKGGYMTRSITQSFVNDQIFSKDFDKIMIHARKIMLKLMGITQECGAQVIDDHNNIPTKIVFKSKIASV